ncbi:hypothetical protein AAH979_05955 [Plantactinospora sp. ZYX-F-223]|uniref:hypothetical protein n=1 Tax=Plantactinospora sp. ZYX-F-223 TaxID=3144103 RepID=UPI0031FD909F
MPLPAPLLLAKALRLLDRGEVTRAEGTLRDALAAGDADTGGVTRVVVLCCLGDLMARQGRRAEAVEMLRLCLDTPVPGDLDDVCADDRARARHLLAGLS